MIKWAVVGAMWIVSLNIALDYGLMVGMTVPREPTFTEDTYHDNQGYIACNKKIKKIVDKKL